MVATPLGDVSIVVERLGKQSELARLEDPRLRRAGLDVTKHRMISRVSRKVDTKVRGASHGPRLVVWRPKGTGLARSISPLWNGPSILATMTNAITVTDLEKRYAGGVTAVDGISFSVSEGEVFALLGPNGAGKTTTVEILEGYRPATAGTIDVMGYDPSTGGTGFRDRIGIVLQETGIEDVMSVRESIDLYASYYKRRRPTDDLIGLVGLDEKADARIRTLSGGQRRRLDLALGLVGDPDLVFLDEPTTGFDPAARRRSWELVANLAALGKTILLTTHYLDEAQYLADRIAVLSGGKIVAEGTPETLGSATPVTTIRFRTSSTSDLPRIGDGPTVSGEAVTYATTDPTADLHRLTAWAVERGLDLERLEVTRPSLEDIYLDIVEHEDEAK